MGDENLDLIKGAKWPLQTYAWSGRQWGSSGEIVNGKAPTTKPPMIITSQPPGAFSVDDEEWSNTFGASHDCIMSLINGQFLQIASSEVTIGGTIKDSWPNVIDFNLFR